MDAKTIWDKMLPYLKEEVSSIGYNTWMMTIEPLLIDKKKLYLRVPADFNKGILEARYYTLLQNTANQVLNYTPEIVFLLPNEDVEQKEEHNHLEEINVSSLLNPKYTFDTFVIGNSNRLAHAASVAVAESPAKAYNPLFLYGGVGLGKTHLMHAIGHFILSNNQNMKVLYVSSEKFTNELINSIKDDKNEDFRAKYRNIDILLIDDIQFIGGKERTQEEFFHTFNALYESNKQIIISSDKPPLEITTLEERLKSRFEWGLIADIQSPDVETRVAILTKKAQLDKQDISYEVLSYIAEKIPSNIRKLEGALTKVIAYASLTENEITIDLAKEALKDLLVKKDKKEINPKLIKETVSRYFDLKVTELNSKRRSREVSYPRQIAMYLCRELTDLSFPNIGDAFGGRDHSTVMHACDKLKKELDNNKETKKVIVELTKTIKG